MEKNQFIAHRPGFVDLGDEPRAQCEFDTLEELLEFQFVKRWRMHPFDENEPAPPEYFYRYSLSDNRLMGEFKGGDEWWVIGFIKHPERLDLPKWKHPNDR